MPRGDGTGPAGRGPMTGRRAGYCAGYGMPGYMNGAYGFGYRTVRGFGGRGRWRGFAAPWMYGARADAPAGYPAAYVECTDAEFETEALTERLAMLRNEIRNAERRLSELSEQRKPEE